MKKFCHTFIVFFLLLGMSSCNKYNDEVAPEISRIPEEIEIEYGEVVDLTEIGVRAIDDIDGLMSSLITTNIQETNLLELGEHEVIFTASDTAGNISTASTKLKIVDTTKPEVKLIKKYSLILERGDDIPDLKEFITMVDNHDQELVKENIEIDYSNVNTSFTGKFSVIATYTDSSGNKSLPFVFNIEVVNKWTELRHFTYLLNQDQDGYIIKSYGFGPKKVVIPKQINNISVTEIGVHALSIKALETVIIPDTVKKIDNYAFAHNILEHITLPRDLEYISNNAFYVNNLSSVTFNDKLKEIGPAAFSENNLEEILLPNSLEIIGAGAFQANEIYTLTIPDNVDIIEDSAFSENNIHNLTLSDKTSIYRDCAFCFNNIQGLVYISENVTELSPSAFSRTSFAGWEVSELNRYYASSEGVLYSKDFETLYNYPSSKNGDEYEVLEGTKVISTNAFYNTRVDNVSLPDSLILIEEYAFHQSSIRSIIIPDKVTTIETGAFQGCYALYNISIGKGLTTLGVDVFNNSQINEFDVSEENNTYTSLDGVMYTKDYKTLVAYPSGRIRQDYTIHSETTKILSGAFVEASFYNFTVPESVVTIQEAAFNGVNMYQLIIEGNERRFDSRWTEIGFPYELR